MAAETRTPVTVTATATIVFDPATGDQDARRDCICELQVNGADTVAFGGPTVTFATGIQVATGSLYTPPQPLTTGDVIYGICDTGLSSQVNIFAYGVA